MRYGNVKDGEPEMRFNRSFLQPQIKIPLKSENIHNNKCLAFKVKQVENGKHEVDANDLGGEKGTSRQSHSREASQMAKFKNKVCTLTHTCIAPIAICITICTGTQ